MSLVLKTRRLLANAWQNLGKFYEAALRDLLGREVRALHAVFLLQDPRSVALVQEPPHELQELWKADLPTSVFVDLTEDLLELFLLSDALRPMLLWQFFRKL